LTRPRGLELDEEILRVENRAFRLGIHENAPGEAHFLLALQHRARLIAERFARGLGDRLEDLHAGALEVDDRFELVERFQASSESPADTTALSVEIS
jgi:hypothetical protein